MRPYYFFLDEDEFEEKDEPRRCLPVHERYWPYCNEFDGVVNPWKVYIDYRGHYRSSQSRGERPTLFVQNKFTVEWDVGPINYMPLYALERLMDLTADRYQVIYSCPRIPLSGYSDDHNSACHYPDREIINRYNHVTDLEQSTLESGGDYNRTKLNLLADAQVYVAVQGGGANILPYFGGSVLFLLHQKGREYPYTYKNGAYKSLSESPPELMLARNAKAFDKGLRVIEYLESVKGELRLPSPYRLSSLPWSARKSIIKLCS
ncbi:hypothetical protein [Candidatus Reidiella endopervernicosa]|nr:hypothetical protein [Candidatus Reidiella endopervernicosa]QKQ24993.1 hypothetical protein HUE57_00850 [Candidatus Reidiella endopervernicosa]